MSSKYILWGGLHSFVISIEHALKMLNLKVNLPKYMKIIMTFIFLALSWIIFRADSIDHSLQIYQGLLTLKPLSKDIVSLFLKSLIPFLLFILITILSLLKNKNSLLIQIKYLVMILSIIFWGNFGNDSFIYTKF